MQAFDSFAAEFRVRPILVVDADTASARLIGMAEGTRLLIDHDERMFHAVVATNVETSLKKFAGIVGKAEREFSLSELATIAGFPYRSVDDWVRQKLIRSSVEPPVAYGKERRFAWADAFIVGCLGHLRRNGTSLPMLGVVANVLYEAVSPAEVTADV